MPLLVGVMTAPDRVRTLYDGLDLLGKDAIRMAAFDPDGRLDVDKFFAQYREQPRFDTGDPNRTSW